MSLPAIAARRMTGVGECRAGGGLSSRSTQASVLHSLTRGYVVARLDAVAALGAAALVRWKIWPPVVSIRMVYMTEN